MSGVFEKNNGGAFISPVLRENIHHPGDITGEITTDDMLCRIHRIFYLCVCEQQGGKYPLLIFVATLLLCVLLLAYIIQYINKL